MPPGAVRLRGRQPLARPHWSLQPTRSRGPPGPCRSSCFGVLVTTPQRLPFARQAPPSRFRAPQQPAPLCRTLGSLPLSLFLTKGATPPRTPNLRLDGRQPLALLRTQGRLPPLDNTTSDLPTLTRRLPPARPAQATSSLRPGRQPTLLRRKMSRHPYSAAAPPLLDLAVRLKSAARTQRPLRPSGENLRDGRLAAASPSHHAWPRQPRPRSVRPT